jgi:hypothetical protein
MLYLRACVNYSWNLWYMSLWYPDGLNLCFPNSWEPESFHKSYSTGVLPDKFPTLLLYQSDRWMKWYALRKWESTLNLCSCPWKRCRPSQKLLAKWWSVCWILSVSFKLILCRYGSDHAVLIQYVWKKFIPVPCLFWARLKYLLSSVNDPVLLPIMFYLRVYPVVSRGYHAFARHLTNFVEVTTFLIIITLRVLGCRRPRTPFSKSNPLWNSIPLVIVTGRI